MTTYVACRGEQGAKEAGKMRVEGKTYVVKDGDVAVPFRFSNPSDANKPTSHSRKVGGPGRI